MSLPTNRTFIQSFHDDEDGLEALQAIMIVAIAAVVLIGLMTFGDKVFEWLEKMWKQLTSKKPGS